MQFSVSEDPFGQMFSNSKKPEHKPADRKAGNNRRHRGGQPQPGAQQAPHAKRHVRPKPTGGGPRPTSSTMRDPATSALRSSPAAKPSTKPARTDAVRIIPLGGCEEVGRNMTVFEWGNDIIILDMGVQFPEEDMPGIDYIIPNISYLKGKEKNIRGVILTHGHLDHIGAVPHLLPALGNPLVIGSRLTLALTRKRYEEFHPNTKFKAHEIKEPNETLKLGRFTVRFFPVTHSIMDALGVTLETPHGNIIHLGDWRYDLDPVESKPTDFSHLAKWNTKTVPSVLLMESLGAVHEGRQGSEREVYHTMEKIITSAKGRIIIGTFSSMLERIGQVMAIAERHGRKVAIDGFSMKTNVEIGKQFGYINIKQSTLIDISQVNDYDDNKVLILCTGAQGEGRAVLMRIATGEHKHVRVKASDTIVFSSSVIPGNERTIQRLKDTLYRKGADVIHKEIMNVHAGGHGKQEDIKLLMQQAKPGYLVPVYANHYILCEAKKFVVREGYPTERIAIPDNGQVMECARGVFKLTNERVPADYVFVDGLGVGDVSHVVLRDRQMMSEDGMVVVIATVDARHGKLIQNPDIISRGFIYMKENKKMIDDVRNAVKKMFHKDSLKDGIDENYFKDKIRNDVGALLYQRTQRRPMILPVVIEV